MIIIVSMTAAGGRQEEAKAFHVNTENIIAFEACSCCGGSMLFMATGYSRHVMESCETITELMRESDD